jgi:uncharacterized Zn finger protein
MPDETQHPVIVARAKHGYYVVRCDACDIVHLYVEPTAAQLGAEVHRRTPRPVEGAER